MAYFIADGWAYSFGVLYPDLLRQFSDSKGKTALIGALIYGVPLVISPFSCALTNVYGCRIIAIIGGAIVGFAFVMSYFATSVNFLCITTGVIASIGLSMTYITAIVIVTFHFEKRRGLATGIAVTGSGIGAFVCPLFIEMLITKYSWRGALLIFGAISLNIIAAGALFRPPPLTSLSLNQEQPIVHNTVQLPQTMSVCPEQCENKMGKMHKSKSDEELSSSRVITIKEQYAKVAISCPDITSHNSYPTPCSDMIPNDMDSSHDVITTEQSQHNVCQTLRSEIRLIFSSMLDKSLALNGCYLLWCASSFILYMWIGAPYVYLVDKALLLKIGVDDAVFLLSIIGIGRACGQIVLGFLGDLQCVSETLLYTISILICGISTALVPWCVTYVPLAFYSAVFGFFVSVTYALQMMCTLNIVGLEKTTSAFGLFQLVQGIATLLGTPLAG